MLVPSMKFFIDLYDRDYNLLAEAMGFKTENSENSNAQSINVLIDEDNEGNTKHYFIGDFYPETISLPEIQANYEELYYRFGAGPLLVFSHINTTSEQLLFYFFADNKKESERIMRKIAKLRALTLPYKLASGLLMPPPKIWIKFWGDTVTTTDGSSTLINIKKQGEIYNLSVLCVVEAVGFNIFSAFPDNTYPRLLEVYMTFREIFYPYRTITMNDILDKIKTAFYP